MATAEKGPGSHSIEVEAGSAFPEEPRRSAALPGSFLAPYHVRPPAHIIGKKDPGSPRFKSAPAGDARIEGQALTNIALPLVPERL